MLIADYITTIKICLQIRLCLLGLLDCKTPHERERERFEKECLSSGAMLIDTISTDIGHISVSFVFTMQNKGLTFTEGQLLYELFVLQSETHSLPRKRFFNLLFPISFNSDYLCASKNVYMLNMFTFNSFSICHSFNQSNNGVTLFTFQLSTQEYRFSQKILSNTEHMS